jgi:nicotinamide phosphoribosyltransferase
VNYLETIISNYLWKPCTTATTALRFRRLFAKYAVLAGAKDLTFVNYQGHDFSFRGLDEEAITGTIGHLLSFNGSDTIPAMLRARDYYKAPLNCGVSVPATEHSVMCAGLQDGEFATFERLLDLFPTGILSVVSDTWDLWTVLTDYLPRLKERLLARDGRLVIRPDSGDPVKIVCGDPSMEDVSGEAYGLDKHPAYYGVIRLIDMAMGSTQTDAGKYLNGVGCIYGDGISHERAEAILSWMVANGYSTYNIVFGIGSYTYQMVTRDTYGLAMKATAEGVTGGEIIPMFKCPVTDEAKVPKKSAKGIPIVYQNDETGEYYMVETNDPGLLDQCALRKVFCDGKLLVKDTFKNISERVRTAA